MSIQHQLLNLQHLWLIHDSNIEFDLHRVWVVRIWLPKLWLVVIDFLISITKEVIKLIAFSAFTICFLHCFGDLVAPDLMVVFKGLARWLTWDIELRTALFHCLWPKFQVFSLLCGVAFSISLLKLRLRHCRFRLYIDRRFFFSCGFLTLCEINPLQFRCTH